DRLAPKALAVLAVGTCATYGGIHAMAGNPTGAMGVPDHLGWGWKSKAGIPIVCVPGCPIHPDTRRDDPLPPLPGDRCGAHDSPRRPSAADLALRRHRARGLRRGRLPSASARPGARWCRFNTGSGCHLDAGMLAEALRQLDPPMHSLLMIENVGNL